MADLSDIAKRDLPPKNHNNPPSELEMLGESLTLKYVHSMRSAEGHIDIVARMPDHFSEENEAVFTTDLIKLMQNSAKHLENLRKEEKEPFLRQGQYVDRFFGDYIEKLELAINKARKPLTDWLQRKADAERLAREADAKLLREQQTAALNEAVKTQNPADVIKAVEVSQQVKVAESIAAQPVISMARSTGKAGSAGLVSKWVGTITDIDSLDIVKLKPYISAAELQKALDRFVKQGGRQCDGATIKETTEGKVK